MKGEKENPEEISDKLQLTMSKAHNKGMKAEKDILEQSSVGGFSHDQMHEDQLAGQGKAQRLNMCFGLTLMRNPLQSGNEGVVESSELDAIEEQYNLELKESPVKKRRRPRMEIDQVSDGSIL